MLVERKGLFWSGVGLFVLGTTFLVLPPYAAYCDSNDVNDYLCVVYRVAVLLGAFIESHNGAVTAIATVFIGLFTWTLKRSTDKMWDAGERQIKTARQIAAVQARQMKGSIREAAESAKTAKEQVAITKMGVIDLERAYLAVGPTQIWVDYILSDVVKARGHTIPSDPRELRVKLFVHNTGRTGATIKKMFGEFADNLPNSETPIYDENRGSAVLTDLSIAAGKQDTLDPFEFKNRAHIGEQCFWGYIEYADIFKNIRTARFCARLKPAGLQVQWGKYQIAGGEAWRECD